jgi:AraC-like DNA-binding protein
MLEVLDFLYGYVRGAIGFSLIMAGIGFLVVPGEGRIRQAFGTLFAAVGTLFSLSALDSELRIPEDLSNAIILVLIYALSQALFEIGLYLFGDEAHKGARRKVYVVGACWSAGLWLLSLLDYPLGLAPVRMGVEDRGLMGPFHAFASYAIYFWPLGLSIFCSRLAHWKFRDLPRHSAAIRPMRLGLITLVSILALVLVASLLGADALYKVGHTSLEAWMLAWYFFIVRKPDAFFKIREEIGKTHERNLLLSEGEAAIVEERLERIVREGRLVYDPSLSVGLLAEAIKLPAYRLSRYFNAHLGTTFSSWLNALRIEYACERMIERPDLTILDISVEAGYASKAVFNAQFRNLRGMSPNEFRKGKAGQGES